MTPEQILIDAIDNVTQKVRYYLKFNICNLGADVEYERGFESALEGVESFLDDFCSKAINTYNEAKATEEDPQWLIGVELDRILENAENGLLRATDVNRIRHLRDELLGYQPAASAKNTQVHPDQATFTLTAEEYDKLAELLDAPAKELPELKRLFSKPSVLEENAQAQDLLTAHPLAEALVKSKNTMVDTTLALFPAYDYLRNPLISQVEGITQTITQHEALIKHSQAVWTVVEKAKMWNRHPEGSKDSELSDAVEALEMMEVKKDA